MKLRLETGGAFSTSGGGKVRLGGFSRLAAWIRMADSGESGANSILLHHA
jgi:hypothetical protein